MRPKSLRASWCVMAVAVIIASIVWVPSGAQQPTAPKRGQRRTTSATAGPAATPLATVHSTFAKAVKVMESALPIYDGHRHRAIELAKHAAREIREAGTSAASPATGATGGTTGTTTQRKTPTQIAAGIPKGANTPLAKYTPQQIAASNAAMQQGLQLLQQGMQQIQALGNDPGNHMSNASEFGNMAIQAANLGLQYVAGK